VRLNLNNIIRIFREIKEYVFPVRRLTDRFKSISSLEQLKNFIKERSAQVTQATLYGYVKTRMGFKYTIMFEDEKFLESLEIAKWNIYVTAIADCTFYTFSYLLDKKGIFKIKDANDVFIQIMKEERSNGLSSKIYNDGKLDFERREKELNWKTYHNENPFKVSGLALYKWAPIAEHLKELDREIVLNSIKYKWNNVESEFKNLDIKFI